MRHPTEGVLRRLIDEPAGVADADREHVAGCPVCLVALADVRADAAVVDAALRDDSTADVDVDAAWRRLSAELPQPGPAAAPVRRRRWSGTLRRPAVAALGAVLVVTGAGVAAANDWLQIFATEQIEPVAVTEADLVQLPDLSAYGELEVTQPADVRPVADAAAAEEATGLAVPVVSGPLPQGVAGDPAYQVGSQVSATFTFSAERAAQAATEAGEPLPPVPAGLDGAQVRLVAGPGVAQVWNEARGVPALVVARAVAPTAYSSGVPFETVRDYLLSLPGLPAQLAEQLRSFTGDGATLPLPVPAEYVTSSSAEVQGLPATVLTSRDGLVAGVVWVDEGVVTAVAGTLSTDEVLDIANGLG
jgi:hypothetical protein